MSFVSHLEDLSSCIYNTKQEKATKQSNTWSWVFFLPCLCIATCRAHLFPWDHSLVFLCNKMNAATLQLDQISYWSQHTHSPGWFYTHRRKTGLSDKKPVLPFKFSNRMSWLVQKTLIYYTAWNFCLLKVRVTLK